MPVLAALPSLRRRLRYLFVEADQTAAEWLTALRSGAWGLWQVVGTGHRLAADAGTTQQFRHVLPAWGWGALLLTLGTAHLLLILSGWQAGRRWAAFVTFLVWGYIFALCAFSGSSTAATPTHLITVLAAGWSYLRLGGRQCTGPG